ncbi:hypothetical protein HanIR_Chr08g0354441 [Helianthus annuus]|nr:hypothetical protein HanIR_Chr08g0354441 [Helianthus annuus]
MGCICIRCCCIMFVCISLFILTLLSHFLYILCMYLNMCLSHSRTGRLRKRGRRLKRAKGEIV